jgi:hypothetical protein
MRGAIDVQPSGAHTFDVSVSSGDPVRAQNVCNLLARRAVERAPATLMSTASIVMPAALPDTPTSPDRPRILWTGALSGIGATALGLMISTLTRRRRLSALFRNETSRDGEPALRDENNALLAFTPVPPKPMRYPAQGPVAVPNTVQSATSNASPLPSLKASPILPISGADLARPEGVSIYRHVSIQNAPAQQEVAVAPIVELASDAEVLTGDNCVVIAGVSADWHPSPALFPLDSVRDVSDRVMTLGAHRHLTVLVTGPESERAYKSRLAAQLALALAKSGRPRVLLLEGDLDHPRVHRALDLEMPPSLGFSQQLDARIQSGWAGPITVVQCTATLHVLAEGVVRAPGLVLSTEFEHVLAKLSAYFDFIVIDGPPEHMHVELRALDSVVDGVVLADSGAPRREIANARPLIGQLLDNKKLIAVVPPAA